MNEDLITIIEDNNQKDYKILLIIDKEFKYIIYTDIINKDLNKDLYVIKVKELKNDEMSLTITDDEWNMIENEYNQIVNIQKNA